MEETYFAPPEKTERRKFRNQLDCISKDPLMTALLTTMAGLLVVLNEDRQIVALNHAFLAAIGLTNPEDALGLRLGQSLNCVHSHEKPAGCGTTPHCSTCGAVIAMMTAIKENQADEQICALTIEQNGIIEDLCLIVKAQPISVDGNRWILVFVQDITQQNFWVNLERVFFHDIRNVLGSLTASAEMFKLKMLDKNNTDDYLIDTIIKSTQRLNEEIAIQSILANEKTVSHLFKKARASIKEIREDLELIVSRHSLVRKRNIEYSWPDGDVSINTVSLLVSRVLGNMLVNAMEACVDGDTIRLSASITSDQVRFDVWNAQVIPQDIQKRIFQRHYSSKTGVGRGLGTYSMKLFGEKYLQGVVDFKSGPGEGTTFSFTLPR
jgi:signal transduction histidine kinase